MQVIGGLASLGAAAAVCLVMIHGTANVLKDIAWRIYRVGRALEDTHEARTAVVNERWMREIER